MYINMVGIIQSRAFVYEFDKVLKLFQFSVWFVRFSLLKIPTTISAQPSLTIAHFMVSQTILSESVKCGLEFGIEWYKVCLCVSSHPPAATVTYDKDAETVCLEFGSELAVGETVISFSYTGCLNDQMRGFYRSKYTINGEERYAGVTQFEVGQSILYHSIPGSSFPHTSYHAGC